MASVRQSQYSQVAVKAINADNASSAISSSYAVTASHALNSGGSPVTIKDKGSTLTTGVTSIDFVGDGVTATNIGNTVTVTIPGGGGGSINTGSFVTTSSFNAYTASINSFTSSINTFTASYNTGSFTGSFTGNIIGTSSWAVSASQTINAQTSSFTPNALITASVTTNTITFIKGDGSTFPITVDTGSGGGTDGGTNLGLVYAISLGYIMP